MIFLTLIYLAFISLGLPDSVLGSAWPFMHADLDVPIGWAGYVAAIVSVSTVVSSLFSHWVIHRFGTGKVTVASVVLTAIALLGFSLSPVFWWLLLLAIPLGLGAGAVDSGLNAFVAEHYSAKHMNWLHCFWGVGAMLGPVFISVLTTSGQSWRSGYASISVVQFVLVALLLYSLPMWRRYEPGRFEDHGEATAAGSSPGLFAPMRVKGAGFAMMVFFLYTSMESSVMLWGASYLVEARGIPPATAAGWISLFFLGLTAGRALSGFLSMKLNNETLIRVGCVLLGVGFILMLLPLAPIVTLIALMLVGLGLAPIFPAMLHQAPVYFGKENARATVGLQMACAYTGTTLMPPLFGQLFAHISFDLMPYVLFACGAGLAACAMRLSNIASKGHPDRRCGRLSS